MYISDFNYHQPTSIDEAIAILSQCDNGAAIAGGTDILVEIKKGLRNHEDMVSLSNIKELKILKVENDTISIGSGLTHHELIMSDVIKTNLPALGDALSKIGSAQVRNIATIGGNLCTGASCCDSAPLLMALGAKVEIKNSTNTYTIPVKELFIFNHKTVLKKGDVLTKIIVPKQPIGSGLHYEKFGLREASSISVVSAAVRLLIVNSICTEASIVIGAVAPVPIISNSSTKLLTGAKVSDLVQGSSLLDQIGQAASDDSIPIDDIRGGAQYRRDILKVITQRAIIKALESVKK